MEDKNVQALFQLQDSYVKKFNIETEKKIDSKNNLNIMGQVEFKIQDIREDKNSFIGQIELSNDLKIVSKEEECAKIHIIMCGLFIGTKAVGYDEKAFEKMLKINGATTLSHLIRAYIYSVTGLSGMPQISTPMVNYTEFFKETKEVPKAK
jgi:preprotein translocase subunit SecB